MSIAVMTEVWKDAPVAGTELLLLLALADSANDDRECWPSLRHLQHKVRVSRPQLQKLITKLVNEGLIEKELKGGKGAKGRESNLYRILNMTGITQDTSEVSQGIPVDAGTGITQDTLNHHLESSLELSSDDDVQQSTSQPKAKTPRPANPIFDAVALGSWGLSNVNGDKTVGAMIGKIVKWLKEHDAEITAERISEFYEWYTDENENTSAPRDVGKFGGWWLKFEAQADEQFGGSDPYAKTFEGVY